MLLGSSAVNLRHYLARYTHRVAISNHRITNFAAGQVSFRWKDYAHGNQKRVMTLAADEFLRRFLQHLLPKRVVRIRSFGFLANRHRTQSPRFSSINSRTRPVWS